MNASKTHGVDQNDATIVIVAWRRPARKTGVCRLHDHDLVGGNAGFQHPPLLDETAGADNRDSRTMSKTKTGAKPAGALRSGNDMRFSDNLPESCDQGSIIREAHTAAVSAGSRDARLNIRLHELGSGCSAR
jgi:hypothetical protein